MGFVGTAKIPVDRCERLPLHGERSGPEDSRHSDPPYGRLHWDKALENATLDIDVRDGQVVVLKGKVDSAAAKQKAEQLTRDTIGVTSVVNELAVTTTSSP